MTSAADIIAGLGGNPNTGKCKCPAHDDRTPSLHVSESGGKVLVHCFRGCPPDQVINALKQRGLWHKGSIPRRRAVTARADNSNTEVEARSLLAEAEGATERPVAYLAGRGIELEPACLKVVDRTAMWKITGLRFPAMVAPITTADGRAVGVQCKFLTLDASEAAVSKDGKLRRNYGSIGGGMVMLADADPDRPFIIAEGIETALSAMQLADLPGAAAISTTNMPKVEPPACSEVIIAADNDDPGQAAAKMLADRLAAAGRRVRIATPAQVNDWNDALQTPDADHESLGREIREAAPVEAAPVAADGGTARIGELAALSRVDYDRVRKAAAVELGIRTATLDEAVEQARHHAADAAGDEFLAPVKPWSEPVDVGALLEGLTDTFDRHIVLPKGASEALALWVVHAHAHDAARHSPILFISSPTKRCGKTNLLSVLTLLVPKPLSAANVTPATVFRAIDAWKPTMLIDESDTFMSDKSELRGVLNSGHTHLQAYVIRCVGDDLIPTQFSTWCPKAFAAIGRLHATLEDRSIKIELRRKLKADLVQRIPRSDAYSDMRRKAARWAVDNMRELEAAEPVLPRELSDRAGDNWAPLLAIADRAGGDWPGWAREAAKRLSAVDDDDEIAVTLLRDMRTIFDREDAAAMWSEEIVTALLDVDGGPWVDFRHGRPITSNAMARLLRPFEVFSQKIRIDDSRHKRHGYLRSSLGRAWKRYLDGDPPGQPGQSGLSKENQGLSTDSKRAEGSPAGPVVVATNPLKYKGKAR